jgi:hypothetical protein
MMSEEEDQARLIAEHVARHLAKKQDASASTEKDSSGARDNDELAQMRISLDEIGKTVSQIESRMKGENSIAWQSKASPPPCAATAAESLTIHSPWSTYIAAGAAQHPSEEKFKVDEATASEIVDFFENEKTCQMEPGHKPCDHCAMCNSRGF